MLSCSCSVSVPESNPGSTHCIEVSCLLRHFNLWQFLFVFHDIDPFKKDIDSLFCRMTSKLDLSELFLIRLRLCILGNIITEVVLSASWCIVTSGGIEYWQVFLLVMLTLIICLWQCLPGFSNVNVLHDQHCVLTCVIL